jgi:hypothetical protein
MMSWWSSIQGKDESVVRSVDAYLDFWRARVRDRIQ